MELLDALETALTTRCGPDFWDTYFGDYDNAAPPNGNFFAFNNAAPQHNNFFAFAIRYGLWRFVEARLQTHGRKSMQKRGRPLLDYACRPERDYYGVWLGGTDVRIVEALLQNGADPNLEFNGVTPWQNAWYTAWGFVSASQLLPVLEVLLTYSADPNAYIEDNRRLAEPKWQGKRRTVLLIAQSHVDNENGDYGPHVTTQAEQEKLDKFIRMLKRGAKAKAWREEDEAPGFCARSHKLGAVFERERRAECSKQASWYESSPEGIWLSPG